MRRYGSAVRSKTPRYARLVRSAILAVIAAAVVLAAAGCGDGARSGARRDCGTKELYGHKLELHVVGKTIPSEQVRKITRGACRPGKVWSCFSFRPPDPVLVWFPERERFKFNYTTAIEARRYPCDRARLTARTWTAAARGSTHGFPSRLQVLADDVTRCKLLEGKTYNEVQALLGRPGAHREHHRHYISIAVGPQRNSFMQTDPEYLLIEFDRNGVFRRISY